MFGWTNKEIMGKVQRVIDTEGNSVSLSIQMTVRSTGEDFNNRGLLQSGAYLSAIEAIFVTKISEMIEKLSQELDQFQLNKGHLFNASEWKEIEDSLCTLCDGLLSNGKIIQANAAAQMNFDLVSMIQPGNFDGSVKSKLDRINGNNAVEINIKKTELRLKKIDLIYKISMILGVVFLISLAWMNAALFKEITTFIHTIH